MKIIGFTHTEAETLPRVRNETNLLMLQEALAEQNANPWPAVKSRYYARINRLRQQRKQSGKRSCCRTPTI